MLKSISGSIAAIVFVTGFALTNPQPAQGASCSSSARTCAVRCKKDNPTDKNCVSDHCTPKFETCKTSGCWQQGGRYGNVLTCNLDRK